jgi:hypothetical protein
MPRQARAKRTFGHAERVQPSGRWRARFTGPDLRRHAAPLTFDTKRDAEAWLDGEQREILADPDRRCDSRSGSAVQPDVATMSSADIGAHTGAMPAPPNVADLLVQYREILLAMHDARHLTGGARRWNKLVNQMQRVHLLLRATADGRAGISALIDDECVTVREWSATNALAWDENRARAALERLVAQESSFSAEMTLREFDAGRLRTDWHP